MDGLELKFIENRSSYLNIYTMASVIDVKTLSVKDQFEIIIEILQNNKKLRTEFDKIVPIDGDNVSMEYIERLIDQDFERYDEVFRRLA